MICRKRKEQRFFVQKTTTSNRQNNLLKNAPTSTQDVDGIR